MDPSSDSDSDDDLLLLAPTFKVTKKAQAQDRNRVNDMLTSMLKDSDHEHASFSRITQLRRELDKDDIDDDELQAQVLQVTQKAVVSRQETIDTMEGIIEDDVGDDGVMDRGCRRELMQAFDTDRSTCLGARRIISFDTKRSTTSNKNGDSIDISVEFYHTHAEAMQALVHILDIMDNGMDTDADASHKALLALVQSMRGTVQKRVFQHLLEQDRLVRLMDKHNVNQLPLELANWLYRLVQSADLESRSLGTLAAAGLRTLVSLLHQKRLCNVFLAETVSLESLSTSLECWVPSDLSRKQSNSMDTRVSTTEKARTNVAGLDHLLQFGEHAVVSPTYLCTIECRLDVITGFIVALAHLGLDPAVTSSKVCINLRQALQRINSSLLGMVAAKREVLFGTENDHVQWMKTTAKAVLRAISGLGPGDKGTEDKDDAKAWLCHSFTVRLFSSVDSNNELSQPSIQFKAILSMQALEICLGVGDMTEQVRRVLNETSNQSILGQVESSLGWLSVVATYAALLEVEMSDEDIVRDGPRCLATVESSFAAFQAGMLLLSSSGWGSAAEYGDEDQAGAISRMVGLLELKCQQLCKRVAPMANNPHFRRVDYNLICCRQQYRFMKERASRLSGSRNSGNVRMAVTCFGAPPELYQEETRSTSAAKTVTAKSLSPLIEQDQSVRQGELSQQEIVDTSQEDVLGLVADDANTDPVAATHPNEALQHQSAEQDRLCEPEHEENEIAGRERDLVLPAASVDAASAGGMVNKARCYRCGRAKVGELHPGDGAANKPEYCKVPENERHEGWIVPSGYAAGDAKLKADHRSIRRAWKRQKATLSIREEQQFEGWP
jgi:hypothetical protein